MCGAVGACSSLLFYFLIVIDYVDVRTLDDLYVYRAIGWLS